MCVHACVHACVCHPLKSLTWKAAEMARNAWWENKAEEAEKKYEMSVKSGRGGSLLKDLRILQRSQTSKTNLILRAANGSDKMVSVEDKLERWRQHFEQVTNVPTEIAETSLNMACSRSCQGEDDDSSSWPGTEEQDEDLALEPSQEEISIREAINQLKQNKAPGVDEITAEMLKLGGEPVVQWLTRLSFRVWYSEKVPDKKGAYDVCDNFRGIALLSEPGKVICRVIKNRLKDKANRALRENQCGFRKGRGCTDHLFFLCILMEKAR